MTEIFTREIFDSFQQLGQLQVVNQWKTWRDAGHSPYRRIADAGFRCYSQFEEDGIILYILTMLGINAGVCVEISCGTGHECMSANLVINHGFQAFLFDGCTNNISAAKSFFGSKKDLIALQPSIHKAWMTRENINHHLMASCCPCDVDLLSMDVDGNDYWLWEAIDYISPKICCFETHDWIPSNLSLTIPYRPDFSMLDSPHSGFRSVSLLAMNRLSKRKGYTLIGAHRHGFNVFYLRNDLMNSFFGEVAVESIHNNAATRRNQTEMWPQIAKYPWVTIR